MDAGHRFLGMAAMLVFLGAGVYLATGFPELHGGDAAIRFKFRANHAYIMLASLLNSGRNSFSRGGPRAGGAASSGWDRPCWRRRWCCWPHFFSNLLGVRPQRPLTTLGV
jgi:hypothetical protein